MWERRAFKLYTRALLVGGRSTGCFCKAWDVDDYGLKVELCPEEMEIRDWVEPATREFKSWSQQLSRGPCNSDARKLEGISSSCAARIGMVNQLKHWGLTNHCNWDMAEETEVGLNCGGQELDWKVGGLITGYWSGCLCIWATAGYLLTEDLISPDPDLDIWRNNENGEWMS